VEGPEFESWQGQGIFLFTESSTPGLEPASLIFGRSFDFFTRASSERGMNLTTHRHLVTRLRISGAVPLLPPRCLHGADRYNFTFSEFRADETFVKGVPKLSVNFEELPLHTNGNCEEQNKVLESSINYYLLHYY